MKMRTTHEEQIDDSTLLQHESSTYARQIDLHVPNEVLRIRQLIDGAYNCESDEEDVKVENANSPNNLFLSHCSTAPCYSRGRSLPRAIQEPTPGTYAWVSCASDEEVEEEDGDEEESVRACDASDNGDFLDMYKRMAKDLRRIVMDYVGRIPQQYLYDTSNDFYCAIDQFGLNRGFDADAQSDDNIRHGCGEQQRVHCSRACQYRHVCQRKGGKV